MIKWLSSSRLKTDPENECPSPYTNDPLAAITEASEDDGKCHIYAVSRVNPLFKEETDATLGEANGIKDQRLSPGKSISSGYESRCNSSSDSSSCTECDEKQSRKSVSPVKREKRLTKQVKSEKKKRIDYEKREVGERKHNEKKESPNVKRKPRRFKNGSTTGPSILTTIPEGKVDCSIPPPIWPRFEESVNKANERVRQNAHEPGRIYHIGTTNPVNFMYKYNERYPNHLGEKGTFRNRQDNRNPLDSLPIKTEYEHNWAECCKRHCDGPNCPRGADEEEEGRSLNDSGKGFTPESTLKKLPFRRNELSQDVLRDLANLIAYAVVKKNSLSLENILKTLADSIQKSLEKISQAENEDGLTAVFDNLNWNSYLSKILATLLSADDEPNHAGAALAAGSHNESTEVNGVALALELQKLAAEKKVEAMTSYKSGVLKDEIYSSGSEGNNSSSSSSGCKDLYMSSNSSSSASKDNIFSTSSFESVHGRGKSYRKSEKSSDESDEFKSGGATESGDSVLKLLRHHRDFSSSSAESAFGFSDVSPPLSDSSSAKGVLNPVFLHENVYSVPKSMRNALICESFIRPKNEDCGSVGNSGSSFFEKLISAKRKTSQDSHMEDLGPPAFADEGKTRLSAAVPSAKVDNTVIKKVEHPYYVAMGRPDFTLDLPQAEKLMKKITSSKRRRCWCRFMTSILGLAFFLLSVMMVSLVVTKGRRMFGAL